jgi:hypothetical protein
MSGPTHVFKNQWGDKLEFYEKFLKMIINDGTKRSDLAKVPHHEAGTFTIVYESRDLETDLPRQRHAGRLGNERQRAASARVGLDQEQLAAVHRKVFSKTSYSVLWGRTFGYIQLGLKKIYFAADNQMWNEAATLILEKYQLENRAKDLHQDVRAILEQDSETGLDAAEALPPKEWEELKEKDNDVEVEDYCENGIWDIDGLRDDLKLMREKLEKKVKPSGKNDEQESEVGTILSPGENDSIKKSDNSGVKSKLEVLRELKALLDEKIIDDEEFKKMKKEIIN